MEKYIIAAESMEKGLRDQLTVGLGEEGVRRFGILTNGCDMLYKNLMKYAKKNFTNGQYDLLQICIAE